jgi:hypothetical protein
MSWINLRTFRFQPYDGLSEDLHLAFDGALVFSSRWYYCEFHIPDEFIDLIDTLQNVEKVSFWVTKRQEQLPPKPDS